MFPFDDIIIWKSDLCWGIIVSMGSTNERRRYHETPSLIGQAHTPNFPDVIFLMYAIMLWCLYHDGMAWKCILHSWPLVRIIHRSLVGAPCKKHQECRAKMFSLLLAWVSLWTNSELSMIRDCPLCVCYHNLIETHHCKVSLIPWIQLMHIFMKCNKNGNVFVWGAKILHWMPALLSNIHTQKLVYFCTQLPHDIRIDIWNDGRFLKISQAFLNDVIRAPFY